MLVERPRPFEDQFRIPNRDKEQVPTSAEMLDTFFTKLRTDMQPGETTFQTQDGREIYINVINPEKVFAEHTAVMVEAHPDDATLTGGVANIAADIGMGVTYISLTDGGARELPDYDDRDTLIADRRVENVEAATEAGAAMVIHLGYPDGKLIKHKKSAASELKAILQHVDPEFYISTNKKDPHKDHKAGYIISKLAGKHLEASHYQTDTQNGRSKWGFRIRNTHHVPISSEIRDAREAYMNGHPSQVKNIPEEDIKDLENVRHMPERHGEVVGRELAAAFTRVGSTGDRMTEYLRKNNVEVIKTKGKVREIFNAARHKVSGVRN